MRRIAILLALTLIAGILAGCTKTPAPEHTTNAAQASTQAAPQTAPASTDEPAGPDDTAAPVFRFTRENFPRMDGSTACIPLAEAVASVLLGESREQAADLVRFNRTTQSFRNQSADFHVKAGQCAAFIVIRPGLPGAFHGNRQGSPRPDFLQGSFRHGRGSGQHQCGQKYGNDYPLFYSSIVSSSLCSSRYNS